MKATVLLLPSEIANTDYQALNMVRPMPADINYIEEDFYFNILDVITMQIDHITGHILIDINAKACLCTCRLLYNQSNFEAIQKHLS